MLQTALDGVHSQIDRPAPPKLTPQNQGTKSDRFQNRFRSVDRNDVTDSDLIFQDQEELLIMPRTTVCASNPNCQLGDAGAGNDWADVQGWT